MNFYDLEEQLAYVEEMFRNSIYNELLPHDWLTAANTAGHKMAEEHPGKIYANGLMIALGYCYKYGVPEFCREWDRERDY